MEETPSYLICLACGWDNGNDQRYHGTITSADFRRPISTGGEDVLHYVKHENPAYDKAMER